MKRSINLGSHLVFHSFLVIPESSAPLLGWDLLHKIGAHIHFMDSAVSITDNTGAPLQVLTLTLPEEYCLYEPLYFQLPASIHKDVQLWVDHVPGVWAELSGVVLAKNRPPIIVTLKPGAMPIRIKQYPMTLEARRGITPQINRLLGLGILVPCHSPWNTPLLPIWKPGGVEYHPVQDLREVNSRVEDIHPTVSNPYTLLSSLSPDLTWYTALDLKDAFFTLPLAPSSQLIFEFEWFNESTQTSGQLTWTRIPQGFKNSPTLFSEALAQDLQDFRTIHSEVTLLQYVDDLLLVACTSDDCEQATLALLKALDHLGYRVSTKKASLVQREVKFLGYKLKGGHRWLTQTMKDTILQIPLPSTARQLSEFLGSLGYCRLWIPSFAEIAQPLYNLTRESPDWE
uniref:Reverse transcriptase domain-containing protein n=1 Tax=Monodelphis domestica TaxID=13616 RepID=A0A5F8GMZ7_MONDO